MLDNLAKMIFMKVPAILGASTTILRNLKGFCHIGGLHKT